MRMVGVKKMMGVGVAQSGCERTGGHGYVQGAVWGLVNTGYMMLFENPISHF